jgi:hypothetical protein
MQAVEEAVESGDGGERCTLLQELSAQPLSCFIHSFQST